MGLLQRIERYALALSEARRRVWTGDQRLWVELRGRPDRDERLTALIAHVERAEGVRWARWNAPLARLVVAYDGDPRATLAAVRAAEAAVGLDGERLRPDPPPHPADRVPGRRTALRMAADVASVALGATLGATRGAPRAVDIDLAALSAALENLPPARRWFDRTLGADRSDLALGLLGSLTSAATHGVSGPAVGLVHRAVRAAEIRAAQRAWARREPELAAEPDAHPAEPPPADERPGPLPKGPIERYSDPAGMVSLGGFGFGIAATGRAERAAASILGAVPRPARIGREAFGAALGRRLAERDHLLFDDRALRRLDRLDRVIVPHELVAPRDGEIAWVRPLADLDEGELQRLAHRLFLPHAPDARRELDGLVLEPLNPPPDDAAAWVRAEPGRSVGRLGDGAQALGLVGIRRVVPAEARVLVAELRALGLSLAVVSADGDAVAWCTPDHVVPPQELRARIRDMQRHGHGVLLALTAPDPAADAADLTVALPRPGRIPWGAHWIAPLRDGREGPGRDAEDLRLVLDAVDAARRASRQSAAIAGAEAAAGLVLSLEGQKLPVLRRILAISSGATLTATLNGARVARQVAAPPAVGVDRTPWHALEPAEALVRLRSSPEGLTEAAAAERRRDPPPEPTRAQEFARALWSEIASPFAPVLATGAGISALMGSPVDAGLVLGTMVAGGVVSGWQQVQASRAMRELERARPSPVRVRRDGRWAERSAQEIVPGDVISLEAGDRVPADCRVVVAENLETDESSLTGESVPVPKAAAPSFAGALAERKSMLYADTTVAAGAAEAVVVAVGEDVAGRRGLTGLRPPARGGVHERLERLTEVTGPIAAGAAVAIVAAGLVRNRPARELVDSAVSLAVAAVPETLPLLATAAQLAAARRLSERGALVRNVAAVEALGRVDVLCADKTGTLTEGVLKLVAIADEARDAPLGELDDALRRVLRAALLASPVDDGDVVPHPTDRALLEGARAASVDADGLERTGEIPFEPGRGYHATAARDGERHVVLVKGAPEVIVPRCSGGDDACERRLARAVALAGRGLRVLAVAERDTDGAPLDDALVRDLTFLGFVCIADPVRPTARAALDALRQAGVDVVMITGDHPATARAIARELGLGDDPRVLVGPELDALDDAALRDAIDGVSVLARATPQLKVRVVRSLQARGRVVAMTGDGANDAPAIRLADVGVALGARATAAARSAADLLVTDERVETLVDAVLEGRAMWASVRDAVSMLLGGNLGELVFTLAGGLVQGTAPLGARQLMLVNLLTDALPALTIAVRPPAHTTPEALLGEGPERSLSAALSRDIAWRAAATAGATLVAWGTARPLLGPQRASTVALLTLVGTQLGQTLVLGWRNPPVVAAALGSGAVLLALVETPGLSQLSGSVPLGPVGLLHVGACTAGGVLGAAVIPPAARWVDGRFAVERRARALRGSPVGRLVRESRLVGRILEAAERDRAAAAEDALG